MDCDAATECETLLSEGVEGGKEDFFAGEIKFHFREREAAGEIGEEGECAVEESHYAYQSVHKLI